MKPAIVVRDSEPVWNLTPPPVVQPSKSAELAASLFIAVLIVTTTVAGLLGWIR
mgnify:CR=1 FL=1